MAKNGNTKKGRKERHVASKISLVLTGIGTFAALILTLVVFIVDRRFANNPEWLLNLLGLSSGTDSGDSLAGLFASGLEDFLNEIISEVLLMMLVMLLISSIWCLIFWLICLKSRYHRVRDVICTVIGRIPVVILGVVLFRINQDLKESTELASALGNLTSVLGFVAVFTFVWAVLMILLSAVGWRRSRT